MSFGPHMSPSEVPSLDAILGGHAAVPDHVVYRAFVHETVVLNLQTGRYHGLNPTGGRMLAELDRAATVRDAVGRLAESYAAPLDELERDVCGFCRDLAERGLIEIHVNGHR
jgi:Coenzyme PQQ synthesis protein D (PqqD)